MDHAQTHIVAPSTESDVQDELGRLQNRIDTALERSDYLLREIGVRQEHRSRARTGRRRQGPVVFSTPLDGAQPVREVST